MCAFAQSSPGPGHGVNREVTWDYTVGVYRVLLFGHGVASEADAQTRTKARRGFNQEQVEAEEKREGKLSIPEIIGCRVRYLCDGAVFSPTSRTESLK
jgi:hypothetical protein